MIIRINFILFFSNVLALKLSFSSLGILTPIATFSGINFFCTASFKELITTVLTILATLYNSIYTVFLIFYYSLFNNVTKQHSTVLSIHLCYYHSIQHLALKKLLGENLKHIHYSYRLNKSLLSDPHYHRQYEKYGRQSHWRCNE